MSALVLHSSLPDSSKHDPKGVETASSGEVFVADGLGSGSFQPQSGGGVTDHGALTGLLDDDHPNLLNEVRHDALPSDNPHGVTAAQVGADPAGTADGVMTTHVAAPDPHPGYVQETLLDSLIATYLDRHEAENATPANNNTTTFVDFLNVDFTLQHAATYKVTAHYVWSLNDAAQDFVAQLLYEGANVISEVHRQEPKDTAGAGSFGTNQRHMTVVTGFIAGTVGLRNLQLQFACGAVGDNAAIYSARIFVERWL